MDEDIKMAAKLSGGRLVQAKDVEEKKFIWKSKILSQQPVSSERTFCIGQQRLGVRKTYLFNSLGRGDDDRVRQLYLHVHHRLHRLLIDRRFFCTKFYSSGMVEYDLVQREYKLRITVEVESKRIQVFARASHFYFMEV